MLMALAEARMEAQSTRQSQKALQSSKSEAGVEAQSTR